MQDDKDQMHSDLYICSPASAQTRAIIRLIKQYRPDVRIHGVLFDTEQASRDPAIHRFVPVAELDGLGARNDILPTGAWSTEYLLERGDVRFGDVCLKREALKVFDKRWILAQAEACGIPYPHTWHAVEDIERYPIFFKQKFEQGGGTRGIARAHQDIPAAHTDALIYQEYIDSPGTYGVGFIAVDGKILVSHGHFEKESLPESGGSAVVLERFIDEKLMAHTEKILAQIAYTGWGLAEFKYCPLRDDYVFMEINAKFWASCELAFANEPGFAKLLFNIDKPAENIERMVFLNRYLRRGVKFSISNAKTLAAARVVVDPQILRAAALGLIPLAAGPALLKLKKRLLS